jgi:hypothetical protein
MSPPTSAHFPHPHHHRAGERHPAAVVPASMLRMGVGQRLAVATLMIALIWAAAFWAMA